MKKSQIFNAFLIITTTLLTGCMTARPIPALTEPSPQPSLIFTVSQTTSTIFQPTDTSTHIPASATPTRNVFEYRPLEILPDIPANLQIDNALEVDADPPFILYFGPQKRTVPINIGNGRLHSPSPDGRWFVYETASPSSPIGNRLIVQSIDGIHHYEMTLGEQVFCRDSYEWLDNQNLICPLKSGATSMVVLNPFTGRQEELASDYPELFLTLGGPAPRWNFGESDVVYNPSLDQVIYPKTEPPHLYIVLWDRKSKKAIGKIEEIEGDIEGNYPLWSPDGKTVAVTLWEKGKGATDIIDEWYLMTLEGQVEQLTQLGDFFENVQLGNGNWSPDGKWLAFWMDAQPSRCTGASLVLFEMATSQLSDTCVMSSSRTEYPPIWSLDSRYIAVRNSSASQTILIDVNQWWAAQIPEANGAIPRGWMTNTH
jgi:hypothetical protein